MQNVVNLFTRALMGPSLSSEEMLARRVQEAHERVLVAVRGKVAGERVSQAQARAERLVKGGLGVNDAVQRAIAWALCATDPNPPTSPAPLAA